MNKNVSLNTRIVIFSALLLIFIVAVIIFAAFHDDVSSSQYKNLKYNQTIKNTINDMIENQEKVDKELTDSQKDLTYTFEDPYIKQDPYGLSPLSAVIAFTTEEKTKVEVYLNDVFITTVSESKNHLIPIYGLYSDAINNVKLVLDDGNEKEYQIKVNSYDASTSNLDIKNLIQTKSHYLVVGNTTKKSSKVRAFDKNNNLVFYLNLNYINGIKIHKEHFYVGYNSINSYQNNEANIVLEMDYLGRIYSISDTSESLSYDSSNEFYGEEINLYNSTIDNYETPEVNYENKTFNDKRYVETITINTELENAKTIDATITPLGTKINFNFDYIGAENVEVLLVDNNYTYIYKLAGNKLNVDIKGKYSVYIKVNDEYYSTLRTIEL